LTKSGRSWALGDRLTGPLVLAGLMLLATLPFVNTLDNPFVYDDFAQVVRNDLVKTLDLRAAVAGSVTHGLVEWYRPLTIYSLALDYRFGGLEPRFYHLTNVLLHVANVLLVVALGRRLLGDQAAVVAAAALFGVHALHTEVVAPVFGRADLLAAMFVLLAWYMAAANAPATLGRSLAIAAAFLAGLLAKESSIAFAPLIVGSDVLMRTKPGISLKLRCRETIVAQARVYSMLALAIVAYLAWRYSVIGGIVYAENTIRYIENPLIEADWLARVPTALWVLVKYLTLFVWPVWLSADYSYNQIPLITSLTDLRLAAIGLAIAAAIVIARRANYCQARLWLILFLLLIVPVSNLFFPIGTIMAERLMYLPSVPLCFLVGVLVAAGMRSHSRWRAGAAIATFAVVLAGNFALAMAHNERWQSEEELFATTVRAAPRSAKAHYNHAATLLEKGDARRAEEGLRTALSLAPVYPEARNRLGSIFLARGELADAEHEFRMALQGAPDFPPALANLGIVMRRQQRYDEAQAWLTKAVDRDPGLATAFVNLGLLAENRGERRAAIALYRRAVTIDPALEFVRVRAEALAAHDTQ
jgi:Tfp pilus assembly protein PilF